MTSKHVLFAIQNGIRSGPIVNSFGANPVCILLSFLHSRCCHEERSGRYAALCTVSRAQYVGGYWHFAEPLRGRFWMIPDPPYCIQTPPTGFLPNLAERLLDPGVEHFHPTTYVLLCFHCTLLPRGSKKDPPPRPPLLARDPPYWIRWKFRRAPEFSRISEFRPPLCIREFLENIRAELRGSCEGQ